MGGMRVSRMAAAAAAGGVVPGAPAGGPAGAPQVPGQAPGQTPPITPGAGTGGPAAAVGGSKMEKFLSKVVDKNHDGKLSADEINGYKGGRGRLIASKIGIGANETITIADAAKRLEPLMASVKARRNKA